MKKIVLLCVSVITLNLNGQVNFDVSKTARTQSTSLSWSHTTGANANTVMLVFFSTATTSNVTSVTYNGTALIQLGSSTVSAHLRSYLYYSGSPSSGAHNVVINLNTSDDIAAGSVTYYNVDPTTPYEPLSTSNGFSTSASVNNVSTPYVGDLALAFVGSLKNPNPPGAGQSSVFAVNNSGAVFSAMSSILASANTTNLSYTITPSEEWDMVGIALRPLDATPLPIHLVSFNAKPDENKVLLNWATASETNNNFFTILRSQNGINFDSITNIKGAGNSTSLINYSAYDNSPFHGTSYYRLKQTDFNGAFTYSDLAPVYFDGSVNFSFSLYPNPASSEDVNITLNAPSGKEVLVVVYNITGNEAYSKIIISGSSNENVYALDPSGKLAAGVYMITATSQNSIYHKKLIIK